MFEFSHTIEAPVEPPAVWRFYQDVSAWPRWSPAVGDVELNGEFESGATGWLTPPGQGRMPLRIVEAAENQTYTAETVIDENASLLMTGQLEGLPDGKTRITHRIVIDGPRADEFGSEFGPQITSGVPVAMQNLADMAVAAAPGRR